ncbi:MAG: tail fiber protein, partial [Azonexus sp.]
MTTLLPQPIPDDPVEGALGHFEHSNWVKAALLALDSGTVHAVGGSAGALAVDGLLVNPAAADTAAIVLQGDGVKSLDANKEAGSRRWRMELGDATAEGGNHSGSMFNLIAYGDTGAQRHVALKASRDTGLVEVAASPTAAKGIATKEYVDQSVPLGLIAPFGGSVAPAGWHICNGTAHGSAALQALIGSPNTPNLTGLFIMGAGTGVSPGTTGGVASNTLTPAQTATKGHGHGGSANSTDTNHQHQVDPPGTWSGDINQNHQHYVSVGGGGHGHNSAYGNNWQGSTQDQNPAGTDYGPIGWNAGSVGGVFTDGGHGHEAWSGVANQGHAHHVEIGEFTSGWKNQNAAH